VQTVSFTRTVELLGPPRDGTFSWYQYVTPGTSWVGMKSSTCPSTARSSITGPATRVGRQLHLPVHGVPAFQGGREHVRAEGDARGASSGIVSVQSERTEAHGFSPGEIHVRLRNRLTRSECPRSRSESSAASEAQVGSQVISEFLLNLGPDPALDGYLLVFYGGQGTIRLVEESPKQGFCDHQGNTQWYCRFDELDPGQRLNIIMAVAYKPPAGLPNWDHDGESVQFKAFSQTPDLNSQNDSSQVNFLFCQTGSTSPDCK